MTVVVSLITFDDWSAYQLKVTFVLATKFIFKFSPLHIVIVSSFKRDNGGLTVTTIVCEFPLQAPKIDIGWIE